MNEWRYEFWQNMENRISRNDVGMWEANELIALVADEGNRRALWAWAMAKSGTLKAHEDRTRKTRKFGEAKLHKRTSKGVSFVAWCQ